MKGERTRINVACAVPSPTRLHAKARSSAADPPYGYRLGDADPHPSPAKAALGQRLHRLERDDTAAPIVQRIYDRHLAGAGLYAIAEGLTRDGVPSPSAHDPARNRHREGNVWSKSAVRAILTDPRSTGRQVWNRQRRDEVLIDVDDVALGHDTKLRWSERKDWIWSTERPTRHCSAPQTSIASGIR